MSTNSGIPGYKIKRLLGKGGMAAVYLAIQESFGREVALKVLSPSQARDEEFSKRFLREAQIVSRLVHPNIVTVYDVGVYKGYHYLSMEYVPGKDLKQSYQSLSKLDAVRIVREVARALDYAAKLGYVHRDVKPENIMLHENGERVILMDFGIARMADTEISVTTTGKVIGTPHYMSPEQTKGLKVDHRSDIYSLGVVFFQLLSSYVPYDADSPVAVGIKHISEPIPRLPSGLEMFQPIINTCMSKNPEHRYQTAAELINALNSLDEAQIRFIDQKVAAIKQQGGANAYAATMVGNAMAQTAVASAATPSHPRPSQENVVIPPLVHPHPRKTPSSISIEQQAVEEPKKSRAGLVSLILLLVMAGFAFTRQNEIAEYWRTNLNARVYAMTQQMGLHLEWLKPPQVEAITGAADVSAPEISPANTPQPAEVADAATAEPAGNQASPAPGRVLTVQEEIAFLRDNLDRNPENAVKLAELYKSLLGKERGKETAKEGIKELHDWYRDQIKAAMDSNDLPRARQLSELLQESFPRVANRPVYQELVQRLEKKEAQAAHMQKATAYIDIRAYESALNEYLSVLSMEPEHKEARAGISKIVELSQEQAREERKKGNLTQALELVNAGLKANDSHRELLSLKKTLEKDIERQQKIASVLLKADQQLSEGKLIEPKGSSAFDLYRQALMIEPNNLKAKNGMQEIQKYYVSLSTRSRMAGKYDESLRYLKTAEQYFGNTPIIDNARQELSRYISTELPKISNIFFSAAQTDSSRQNASSRLQLGGTLFVGFHYENFRSGITPLQVYLLDGTGQVVILEKSITVSGSKGEHLFDIKLPQSATFTEGSYNMEIRYENQPLISAAFVVEK